VDTLCRICRTAEKCRIFDVVNQLKDVMHVFSCTDIERTHLNMLLMWQQ
jgi:hypothetical protein